MTARTLKRSAIFLTILFIVLQMAGSILLLMAGFIHWSSWWVFVPIWITFLLFILLDA